MAIEYSLGRTHANAKRVLYEINDNNCWVCVSHAKSDWGYVNIKYNRKWTKLHRLVYEREHGVIAEGNVIMHTCDNPECINPAHLIQGTNNDNMQDKKAKGRTGNHYTVAKGIQYGYKDRGGK